jgi:hypothetical protein
MPRHFNVLIEPMHPYTETILWPSLRDLQKRNVKRIDNARNQLQKLAWELLDGRALRDRQIAYQIMEWAKTTPQALKANDRHTFPLQEFILTIERWDN